MFKKLMLLAIYLPNVFANLRELKIRTCPTCPPCTQCDSKRGTCTIPLNYVSCEKNSLNGVCISGFCNTQITLPIDPLEKCQAYQCPQSGICNVINLNDGTDCTFVGNAIHSYCLKNGCKAVLDGLTPTLPNYNIGCLGLPDGLLCDTNENFFDDEECKNEICQFPDGRYNGILP